EHPNRAVHNAAVQALAQFEGSNARRDALLPLLPWLSNPKWADLPWGERDAFIQSVAMTDLPESVPGLIRIIENEGNNINWAADSLAKYKDPRAVPALRA